MKRLGYFFGYLTLDFIVGLIIVAISSYFLWNFLTAIIGFLTLIAIIPMAWQQSLSKVNESSIGDNNQNNMHNNHNSITIRMSGSYDDDEDYDDAKNSKWYGNGEDIKIHEFKISNPLIYISNSGKKSSACHVVPTKLKISKKESYDSIGYWPSYSDLNAGQRKIFLAWLAGGKSDTTIDIGYVFIYFYGLEYRILKDCKDLEIIANEVIRLRELYSTNNSFRSYSEGLLAYIISKLSNKDSARKLLKVIEPTLDKYSYIYRSGINLLLKESKKLTEDEVISCISSFENVARSSIPRKVGKYFDQYFRIIAKTEIEEAISVIEPKEYNERYYSASSYLRDEHTYKGLRIIVDRKIQNKLGKKWTQAIDAFRPYSRKLAKNQAHEIFHLLPQELRRNLDHPLKDKLKDIESTLLDKTVSLSEIVSTLGMNVSDKLKQKDCREIVDTLLSNNLIIEPNIAYFKKSYKLEEKVILSKIENASMLDFDDYKLAALMTDFGIDLAYSDNDYSISEVEQIYSLVSENFLKRDIEKKHLKLRVELYKSFKPKMNGVFKKLSKSLGLNELKILSDYLIRVALADGVFTKEEDKKIRTSLSKLGLEDSYIKDLYEKFGINEISENVELRHGGERKQKGSIIPKQQREIILDKDKLSQLAEDTRKVKSVLSEIITVEEREEAHLPQEEIEEVDLTLDEKHLTFLKQVIQKNEWEKKELREIAKGCGLMVNAAISKINEWSEEKYGDYLVYEEDRYHIQSDVLEEVKTCA